MNGNLQVIDQRFDELADMVRDASENMLEDTSEYVQTKLGTPYLNAWSVEQEKYKKTFSNYISGIESYITSDITNQFSSVPQVIRFFASIDQCIDRIQDRIEETRKCYQYNKQKADLDAIKIENTKLFKVTNFVFSGIALVFLAFTTAKIFSEHWPNEPVIGILFFGLFFLVYGFCAYAATMLISFPIYVLKIKKALENQVREKQYEEPKNIQWLLNSVGHLRKLTESSKQESLKRVDFAIAIEQKKALLEVEDTFHERLTQRSTRERLSIISAELEAAKGTAKTFEEQHEKTEAVRVKYTKELIDLQRQVKAEDNQDLTQKLDLLQKALGENDTI
jgi:hypothetical protein